MAQYSILLVEDDADVRKLLKTHLLEAGASVDEAVDGEQGAEMAQGRAYDFVILDLNLPKKDGLEVCRIIRQHNALIPILMLTARKEEIDRVLGLELGADDYLTKPFNMRELIARIRAILKRVGVQREREQEHAGAPAAAMITIGDVVIDVGRRIVTRGEKRIPVSNMEFELLLFLVQRPGKAVTREEILDQVWGYTAVEYAQNVSTHINRLRKKLEPDPEKPVYVKTVRGFGYAFAEQSDFEKADG